MKVTKAKSLNAKPFGSFFAPCRPGPAGHLEAPQPIEATAHSTRPRFASAFDPANQRGRGFARPAPSSARKVRWAALLPSGPLGRGSGARRTHERCCIEGLCFGDFHLARQMKVTRPPGRDPASNEHGQEIAKSDGPPPAEARPGKRRQPKNSLRNLHHHIRRLRSDRGTPARRGSSRAGTSACPRRRSGSARRTGRSAGRRPRPSPSRGRSSGRRCTYRSCVSSAPARVRRRAQVGFLAVRREADAVHRADVDAGIALDAQLGREHRLHVAVQAALGLLRTRWRRRSRVRPRP